MNTFTTSQAFEHKKLSLRQFFETLVSAKVELGGSVSKLVITR